MITSLNLRPISLFDVFPKVLAQQNYPLYVDVKEDKDKFVLSADVPGVDKENISITFEKGILNISVEKQKREEIVENERWIRQERHFSKKVRSFNLGDDIDSEKIKANYKDGVLTLDIPKKEVENNVRNISVE